MGIEDDLQKAFSGECQAYRKYLAFADKAESEGYSKAARLFRALAISETAHSKMQLEIMDEVRSTPENLRKAIEVEEYESQGRYPEYINDAEQEGNEAAAKCLKHIVACEQIHYSLLIEGAKRLEQNQPMNFKSIFVCSECGNTMVDEKPENCAICGTNQENINEVL